MVKQRNADEFEEGKHFISVTNRDGNPRAGIPHQTTMWTKIGVVMLGFFIKSPQAVEFRRWASRYIVDGAKEEPQTPKLPTTYLEALEEGIHWVSLQNETKLGGRPSTYWTKIGVVMLGFFIKTSQAKQFRDWAEDEFEEGKHYLTVTNRYAQRITDNSKTLHY
jgi:hypothetical protein